MGSVADEAVCPGDEVFHVRCVRMTAVMLSPGKLAFEQTLIHWRHLSDVIISGDIQSLSAKQPVDAARIHRSHKAPVVVEPACITLLRNTVADERQTWSAESDEFVRIDRNIACVHASKRRFRGAVL